MPSDFFLSGGCNRLRQHIGKDWLQNTSRWHCRCTAHSDMKKGLFILLCLLIVLRLALPVIGKAVINNALENKLGVYTGQIKDFDLSLYRGAYQVEGLDIRKKGSKDVNPLIGIGEIDLSISWRALLSGKLACDIRLREPEVQIIDSGNKDKTQLGKEEPKKNWAKVFETIIPIDVENVLVHRGKVLFLNRDLEDPVPVRLEKIALSLQRIQTHNAKTMSPFLFSAVAQGHAYLTIEGKMNLLAEDPQMDLNYQLENFKVQTINKTLRAYVPIDVTQSTMSLYGEFISKEGSADGYVKAFLKDTDIVRPKQSMLNTKHLLIELASGISNWFLENDDANQVAALIPFKYRAGKWDVDTREAFWSTIENKFDKMEPGIENVLSL
jgi:hypothetical protein